MSDNDSVDIPLNQMAFGLDPITSSMTEEIDLLEKDTESYLNELKSCHTQHRRLTKVVKRLLKNLKLSFRQMDSRERDPTIKRRAMRRAIRKANKMMKRAKRFLAINRRNAKALGLLIKCYRRNNK
jgi:hypothetical protein